MKIRDQTYKRGTPILLGLVCLFVFTFARADEYVYSDVNVKVAYIVNILGFIDFPEDIPKKTICVVGDDLVGLGLAKYTEGTGTDSSFSVVKKEPNSSLDNCHILFVSESRAYELKTILYKIKLLPALSISDIYGFSRKGGMIELTNIDNRVRLIVNRRAAEGANLRLSAKLLQVAYEVIGQ